MSRIPMLLVVLALLLVAACQQQEPSIALEEQVPAEQRDDDAPANDDDEPAADADAAETVQVEAGDLYFEGIPDSLPAGVIEFQMDNAGNLPHDLVVEELGDEVVVAEIGGGETGSGTVELDPGEYTFYCDVPGHRAGGMEATVTVE